MRLVSGSAPSNGWSLMFTTTDECDYYELIASSRVRISIIAIVWNEMFSGCDQPTKYCRFHRVITMLFRAHGIPRKQIGSHRCSGTDVGWMAGRRNQMQGATRSSSSTIASRARPANEDCELSRCRRLPSKWRHRRSPCDSRNISIKKFTCI